MKDLIETILKNFIYIYPGFIFLTIYQYIDGDDREASIDLFFLKIVCVSYVMVELLGAIFEIIFAAVGCDDKNIISLTNIIGLLLLSCILPFFAVRIRKSKLFAELLKKNKISRSPYRDIIEQIRHDVPSGKVVYITVYLENVVYAGILKQGKTGENGFFRLNNWKKYIVSEDGHISTAVSDYEKSSCAVIPLKNVIHYYYEYIPAKGELPDKII